jgi:hypothetical protein
MATLRWGWVSRRSIWKHKETWVYNGDITNNIQSISNNMFFICLTIGFNGEHDWAMDLGAHHFQTIHIIFILDCLRASTVLASWIYMFADSFCVQKHASWWLPIYPCPVSTAVPKLQFPHLTIHRWLFRWANALITKSCDAMIIQIIPINDNKIPFGNLT